MDVRFQANIIFFKWKHTTLLPPGKVICNLNPLTQETIAFIDEKYIFTPTAFNAKKKLITLERKNKM
jgi:hypothetical protein